MFLFKRVIRSLIFTVFSFLAAASCLANIQYLTIGTGDVSGIYYPIGGALCNLINQRQSQIHCEISTTGGSLANVSGIRSGSLDLGVIQSDWQYHAYKGTDLYAKQGEFKNLRSLFSIHVEPFTVLARADADINSFDDLQGKRVNIGPPQSGLRATLQMLFTLYGWELSDFATSLQLNSTEQVQALCSNQVDAIFYMVGHPNRLIKDTLSACNAKLVNVSGEKISALINNSNHYRKVVIPGGTYRGSEQDISTFGVAATIITTAKLNDDVVYQLVKSIFENHQQFIQLHPAFNGLSKYGMVSDSLTAPLHAGAVRYYQEVGLLKTE